MAYHKHGALQITGVQNRVVELYEMVLISRGFDSRSGKEQYSNSEKLYTIGET